MSEHRETEIRRDADGRVISTHEYEREEPRRRRGVGVLWGLVLGAALLAGGVAIYANNQGGFEQAGAQADQGVERAAAESQDVAADVSAATSNAAEQAGDALETAGDRVESATDNTAQ